MYLLQNIGQLGMYVVGRSLLKVLHGPKFSVSSAPCRNIRHNKNVKVRFEIAKRFFPTSEEDIRHNNLFSRQMQSFTITESLDLNDKQYYQEALQFLEKICRWIDSKCIISVFGSYATGLSRKDSDIDVHVRSVYPNFLKKLYSNLIENKYIYDVEFITAKVNICRIITKTGVQMDVNNDQEDSLDIVDLIKDYIQAYPQIIPIFFVIKKLLQECDLNQVYTGGLSSISLQYMIIVYLLNYRDNFGKRAHQVQLSVLLRHFFSLYGYYFDYDRVAINMKDATFERYIPLDGRTKMCIWDPHKEGHNVASGTYRVPIIRALFRRAYDYMTTNKARTLAGLITEMKRRYTRTGFSMSRR